MKMIKVSAVPKLFRSQFPGWKVVTASQDLNHKVSTGVEGLFQCVKDKSHMWSSHEGLLVIRFDARTHRAQLRTYGMKCKACAQTEYTNLLVLKVGSVERVFKRFAKRVTGDVKRPTGKSTKKPLSASHMVKLCEACAKHLH